MDKVTLESKVKLPPKVTFGHMDEEVAIFHEETGQYYGLDDVGSRVWEVFHETSSLREALTVLMGEFEIEESDLEEAIVEFVKELVDLQLLMVREEK